MSAELAELAEWYEDFDLPSGFLTLLEDLDDPDLEDLDDPEQAGTGQDSINIEELLTQGSDEVEITDGYKLFLRDAAKMSPLTSAQEVVLAKRIEQGDLAARNQMAEASLHLVIPIAKRHMGRGVPLLDLIDSGALGLVRAAEKFDYRLGYKFSTYATWWVRRTVAMAVLTEGTAIHIPAKIEAKLWKIKQVELDLFKKLKRLPTAEETAGQLDWQLDEVTRLLHIRHTVNMVSLDRAKGQDGVDVKLGDAMYSAGDFTERLAIRNIESKQLVSTLHRRLLPAELGTVLLRFGLNGSDPTPIGVTSRKLGLTREAVRHAEKSAMRRLAYPENLPQMLERLSPQDAEMISSYNDFTEHTYRGLPEIAEHYKLTPEQLAQQLQESYGRLAEVAQQMGHQGDLGLRPVFDPPPPETPAPTVQTGLQPANLDQVIELRNQGKKVPLKDMPQDFWWVSDGMVTIPRFSAEALGADF